MNDKLAKKSPTIEEVARNISIVQDEISHGNSSIVDIQKSLAAKDIKWDYAKVQRYYRGALELMGREHSMKQLNDQRQILLQRAETIESSEWEMIRYLLNTRQKAMKMIDDGSQPNDLPFEYKEVVSLPLEKLVGIITKCKQTILQAIRNEYEYYGFSNDKTLTIQHQKTEKLKYMDDINKDLRDKFRNRFDVSSQQDLEDLGEGADVFDTVAAEEDDYEVSVLKELTDAEDDDDRRPDSSSPTVHESEGTNG
jgi:hypothetical protein